MTSPHLSSLLQWLDDNSVWYDKSKLSIVADDQSNPRSIRVIHPPNGSPAKVDDVVVKMPKDSVLSAKTCLIADILEKFDLDRDLLLTLALLHERSLGPSSPWHSYLASLPPSVPLALPLWSLHDISLLLKGTEAEKREREQREEVERVYREVVQPMVHECEGTFVPKEAFDYERFVDAMTVVTSRAFSVDPYHGPSLVPLADAFNHRSPVLPVPVPSDSPSSTAPHQVPTHQHQHQFAEHVHVESDTEVCRWCGVRWGYCLHDDVDDVGEGEGDGKGDDDDHDDGWSDASSASTTTTSSSSSLLSLPSSSSSLFSLSSDHGPSSSTGSADAAERIEVRCVRGWGGGGGDGGGEGDGDGGKVGEEVFNTYGPHSNASLLRLYGFTDPLPGTNPYDGVSVAMDLVLSTALSLSLLPPPAPTPSRPPSSTSARRRRAPHTARPQRMTDADRVEVRVGVWMGVRWAVEVEGEEGGDGDGEGHVHDHDHPDGGCDHGHSHSHSPSHADNDHDHHLDDHDDSPTHFTFLPRCPAPPSLLLLLHCLALSDGTLASLLDSPSAMASFVERVGRVEEFPTSVGADGEVRGKKGAATVVKEVQGAVSSVHAVVAEVARWRMAEYPTGLSDDERVWEEVVRASTPHTPTALSHLKLRAALVVRISEKRVLQGVVERYSRGAGGGFGGGEVPGEVKENENENAKTNGARGGKRRRK
ncbi:hypothetical protein HDU93_008923 [Gonapodya sp. JEL0774]|nr:hypothetical protein HDU93_008923 [Gonapodya sp. JEL0774]